MGERPASDRCCWHLDGGREGGKERGRERGREGGREGEREGGRKGEERNRQSRVETNMKIELPPSLPTFDHGGVESHAVEIHRDGLAVFHVAPDAGLGRGALQNHVVAIVVSEPETGALTADWEESKGVGLVFCYRAALWAAWCQIILVHILHGVLASRCTYQQRAGRPPEEPTTVTYP